MTSGLGRRQMAHEQRQDQHHRCARRQGCGDGKHSLSARAFRCRGHGRQLQWRDGTRHHERRSPVPADVVATSELVTFGIKSSQMECVKRVSDGSILYWKRSARGTRELAAVSKTRYPATMNADGVVSALDPNAQGDGGNGVILMNGPGQNKACLRSLATGATGNRRVTRCPRAPGY